MTNNVALSGAMRSNLLSLVNTQRDIDTVQSRLATGRKVNSALDDPRNFFAAQALNNRAGDLNRLLDSMGQSISTIKEADNGVSSLSKLIEQADSLAIQAKEELTNAQGKAVARGDESIGDVTDLHTLAGIGAGANTFAIEVDGTASGDIAIASGASAETLVAQINDIAALEGKVEASLNESGQLEIKSLVEDGLVRITDGAANGMGAQGLASLGLSGVTTTESTAGTEGGTIVAGNKLSSQTTTVTDASTLMNGNFVTLDATETATVSLTVDGKTSADIVIDDDTSTVQGFIDDINNDTNLDGALTASFNADTGQIEIETDGTVSTIDFQVTAAGAITTTFGFGAGALDDSNAIADTEFASESFTMGRGAADVSRLEADFNEIRNQIDALVNDAGYRGTNLLKNDNLETVFNEDRTNKLTTEGVDFTSTGLGLTEADFSNSVSVQVSIDQLLSATNSVRDFGSSIANDLSVIQTRQDFTEKTIETLEEGSDKLTLADPNEEGAKLLSLQTRQQLSITSLALASQSQSAVLSLF